jgi:hypothetical protein
MPIFNDERPIRVTARASDKGVLRRFSFNSDRRAIPVSLILYRIILLLSVVASMIASYLGIDVSTPVRDDSHVVIDGHHNSFPKEKPYVGGPVYRPTSPPGGGGL